MSSCFTVSNAVSKSTKHMETFVCMSIDLSIIILKPNIALVVPVPFLNPTVPPNLFPCPHIHCHKPCLLNRLSSLFQILLLASIISITILYSAAACPFVAFITALTSSNKIGSPDKLFSIFGISSLVSFYSMPAYSSHLSFICSI